MSELKFKYMRPRCLWENDCSCDRISEYCLDDLCGNSDCIHYISVEENEPKRTGRSAPGDYSCAFVVYDEVIAGKSCKNYEVAVKDGILKIGKKEYNCTEIWIDGVKVFDVEDE